MSRSCNHCRSLTRDLLLASKKIERAERENAELRKALTQIVNGGYAPGADVAHPAIGVARSALAAAREAGKGGAS